MDFSAACPSRSVSRIFASRQWTASLSGACAAAVPRDEDLPPELARGYERVVLLRAEATWLLQQRGHDVSKLVQTG